MPVGKPVRLADHMKSTMYAHLGDHDKFKKEESQQDYRVEFGILHPRYHRSLMTDGDDIALLYLSEPVDISKSPIVLFVFLNSQLTDRHLINGWTEMITLPTSNPPVNLFLIRLPSLSPGSGELPERKQFKCVDPNPTGIKNSAEFAKPHKYRDIHFLNSVKLFLYLI